MTETPRPWWMVRWQYGGGELYTEDTHQPVANIVIGGEAGSVTDAIGLSIEIIWNACIEADPDDPVGAANKLLR